MKHICNLIFDISDFTKTTFNFNIRKSDTCIKYQITNMFHPNSRFFGFVGEMLRLTRLEIL